MPNCLHTRITHIFNPEDPRPDLEVLPHNANPTAVTAVQWCPDCGALGVRRHTDLLWMKPNTIAQPTQRKSPSPPSSVAGSQLPSASAATSSLPGNADDMDRYHNRVRARMRAGQKEYGDRSFSREPLDLTREIQEELEDVSGWAFILWQRLERARCALEAAE